MRKISLRSAVYVALPTALAALGVFAGSASAQTTYTPPPTGANQWYWEIDPPSAGLAGLPATSGAYPSPGSADIWDTDLFQDSNTANAGIPTGPSPVVEAIHAAGHYSICYVEAGAYQVGFPDDSDFASADYGGVGDTATEMQGYPDEYWFDLTGFRNYVAGDPSTLTGAAVNIAAGLNRRFQWCKLEGQDAVEPDDLDGYTNKSQSGVLPWGMTQADSAGFERWLAYDIHSNGLAAFQKNDPANEPANAALFDGMIIEECNYYNDPCSGSGGDATAYLALGKPVLNAEYTQDSETTAKFCAADIAAGIAGALFDVNLSSGTYQPCAPAKVKVAPSSRQRTTRATVGDQRITLVTPSPLSCSANTKKLVVTLASTMIATGARLRFARASFYIDAGANGRHPRASATARHVPIRLDLSLAGLKAGTHKLTVKVAYTESKRTDGHTRNVPVTKTLRVTFSVC
jgi:hypothetical protein